MGRRNAGAIIVALASALALAGCSAAGAGSPAGATSAPRPVPSSVAPPGNVEPVLRPELPAAENLAFFDSVNR